MLNNWKTYKLSEVTVKIGSGATPRGGQETYKSSGISLIRSQNVLDFTFSTNGLAYIDEKQASKLNNVTIEENDILLNITGDSVARVCKVPSIYLPARVNQHVSIVRANPSILNPDYLKYSLLEKTNKDKLLTLASAGATRNAITKNMIENFEIVLPELPEQQSIASILSAIDDKIENNLAINKTLEEMAMALYNHWFVDFGPFQDGEFVESELGRIPMGWEVKRLDEICNITIGRTPPRKEPKWFSQNEGVKWISIKDIGNSGIYISKTSEYLSEEAIKKFNVPVINPNTVILSFKLTVGRVAISSERMLSNEAIAHLNRKDSEIPVEYIYSYLKLFDYNSLGSTSSIATAVNTQTIKAMKIIIPDKKLLNSYFEKVNTIFEQIKINQNENQTLTQLRDTLLPKLISGEVRLKAFREENEKRA
jgi:type I restriction enzyme S subunit